MAVNNNSHQEPEWKRYIPLGYVFHPTDREVFKYLLARVHGEPILPGLIHDTDIYQCQPSDLPGLEREAQSSFFFTLRERKYPNGKRPSRFTKDGNGYWRMTSKLNEVRELDGLLLGKKNTLVYTLKAEGEQGKGRKMDWIMQEYVLDESLGSLIQVDDVVLCKIYEKKSGKESEKSPSDRQESSVQGRLCTESSVVADHQTSLGKRKQSPVHYTVLEVGEPSCSGQWNSNPQPYEPSKKSKHSVGEPCQLPTKSSPFQVGQINNRLISQYLVYETSGLGVGKSSCEAACQLNQQQSTNQQEAFRPLSSVTPPTWEISETNSSGLMVFNHNQYIRQLPTMIDRNDPLIPPMLNHDDQYGPIAAGSRGQQIPFEESTNVGFQNNLVFSNEHDDHQQLQNNMSTIDHSSSLTCNAGGNQQLPDEFPAPPTSRCAGFYQTQLGMPHEEYGFDLLSLIEDERLFIEKFFL
ncbi:unnamed protein product [Ilex paraguariensis]|uniref:NAC domain-containing protein n=1 Tax=Ilex paraguariensis TaxID=185542 RepID=A0ABC8V0K5_9AQUA